MEGLREGVRQAGPMERALQTFFCQGCDKTEQGTHIPNGWYGLNQFAGGRGVPPTRIGLFCSADCIVQSAERIARRGGEIGI